MRLLKRHPDETDADELGVEEGVVEGRRVPGPGRIGGPGTREPDRAPLGQENRDGPGDCAGAIGQADGGHPVTVVRAYVHLAQRELGPAAGHRGRGPLAVVGSVALVRTGIDGTWFRPRIEVLDADHTALLGALEIGAGLLLLLGGLTGSRVLVAILGLAMALGATAVAIEPQELQRELAIESWWAWTLAAAGVVLTLSALQAPREHRKAVVDVP